MGKKRLEIRVFEENPEGQYISSDTTFLDKNEYPNVYLDKEVSDIEFNNAIDTIITHFKNLSIRHIRVDLDTRDKAYTMPRKMTIEEIENLLGFQVSIVTEKSKREHNN